MQLEALIIDYVICNNCKRNTAKQKNRARDVLDTNKTRMVRKSPLKPENKPI